MSKERMQPISAAGMVVLGAVIVWAISSIEQVQEVHPRFPAAIQLYGVYLMLLAPLALLPIPLPALGRLGLWNALGIGLGALAIGASRSGALLAIPVVCIAIAIALWPAVPYPERDRIPLIIVTVGGALAALLPAAWHLYA